MATTVFPGNPAFVKAVYDGYRQGAAMRELHDATGMYFARIGKPGLFNCLQAGHHLVKEDFGRKWRCMTCQPERGDPAPEGPGTPLQFIAKHGTNCPNCGAAREPVRCSFCLTPTPPA